MDTIFYLSIHWLVDIWVVSTFWLLRIMLLWTLVHIFAWTFDFISRGVYLPSHVPYQFNLIKKFCSVLSQVCFSFPCIFSYYLFKQHQLLLSPISPTSWSHISLIPFLPYFFFHEYFHKGLFKGKNCENLNIQEYILY